MTNPEKIRQDLGCLPFEADARLMQSYVDPTVHGRFTELKQAASHRAPALKAQLNAYLAAGYGLFPEEVKVIYDSVEIAKNEST